MSIDISYKDLNKDMLSEKAQLLLSEFISTWQTKTGELIDLNSDDVVIQVLQSAKLSKSRRLRSIYLHLRAEVTNKILTSLTPCDEMLADQMMSHIAQGRTSRFRGTQFFA